MTRVGRAPAGVGEPTRVEELQEDVEHPRVRLLHLVEEEQGVGPGPKRAREASLLVVADVAGRGADELRDAVLLHHLGHVEANELLLGSEEVLGQEARRLRLAYAAGSEEEENGQGPAPFLERGPGQSQAPRDPGQGLVLAHDP